MNKEAILYEKLPNNKVRCTACARYCELGEGQTGLCGIRGNENGRLDEKNNCHCSQRRRSEARGQGAVETAGDIPLASTQFVKWTGQKLSRH